MSAWTLDRICELTKKPEVLNALHACREGHPWNKTVKNPWHSAWFLCEQQPSYVIPSGACEWLLKMSAIAGEIATPRARMIRQAGLEAVAKALEV